MTSLYERLGETGGISQIAADAVDLHVCNSLIAPRFSKVDIKALKKTVANFFVTGTGGPNVYKGKDILSAHKGMNIDHAEFMAVLDDVLEAIDKNRIGQREKEEVLFILYNMRGDVVRV